MEIVIGIICAMVGVVFGVLITQLRAAGQLAKAQAGQTHFATELETARQENATQRLRQEELSARCVTAESESANLRQRLEEEAKRITEIQNQFRVEFENLANRILEEKSTKFLAQNQEHISTLLDPLRARIGEFRERIDIIHTEDAKTSSALREQLQNLKELNQQITEEAGALTKALKGESKTQGSWGELILERILEKSGLQKGSEYETQISLQTIEGERRVPDVIINLPEGKHIVIDAKVSLTAYDRFVNDSSEALQQAALRDHIRSIRQHVERLAEKDYHSLPDIQSPDLVLMFVPIESALYVALQHDTSLYGQAFEKNVILVSSSTLLTTLRVIESVWRRHKQTVNAQKIAKLAGNLYDCFVGFSESLEKIGERIEQAQKSYEQALSQLRTGRGNLVRRAEELKRLGARAEKQLSASHLEHSIEEEPPLL